MSRRNNKPKASSNSLSQRPAAERELLIQRQSLHFSGPLPHPATLEKYNQIIPNGAERILAMAERQSTHREHLEKTVVEGGVKAQTRGSWQAFSIFVLTIAGSIFLIYKGHSITGLSGIILALATGAGIFIWGRMRQEKERRDKADSMPQANDEDE